MNVKGTHVFVTGAAKRLGRAIAESFLPHGVTLSAHCRVSRAELESLERAAEQAGSRCHAIKADLRNVNEVRRAVKEAEDRFGPVDILINSASSFYPTPALQVTEDQWNDLVDANVKGQFFLAQACAPGMMKKGGVIINLGDVNGERPLRNFTPYAVGKAGILMLTRNLALEWAPKVRVNSVSPGPVLVPPDYTAEKIQKAADRTLLKRWGSPEDIVSAVHFLIGNDYITGFDLKVDGGKSIA